MEITKNVEAKTTIKCIPRHIESNLEFCGGNKMNGNGSITSDVIPNANHTIPIWIPF